MKKAILLLFISVLAVISVQAQSKNKYHYFKGKVGSYDVTFKIREDGWHGFDGGDQQIIDFVGSYTYVKRGNTLNLEGHTSPDGVNENGNIEIELWETTPKGNTSAHWILESDPTYDDTLTGKMTVLKTDKTYKVILHRVKTKK